MVEELDVDLKAIHNTRGREVKPRQFIHTIDNLFPPTTIVSPVIFHLCV